MLWGPRHMPDARPPRHGHYSLFNAASFLFDPLFLFLSSLPPSLSCSLLQFSFLFHFLLPSSFSLLSLFLIFKYTSRGPAGPLDARGPRHVPFMPLKGSGTGPVISFSLSHLFTLFLFTIPRGIFLSKLVSRHLEWYLFSQRLCRRL